MPTRRPFVHSLSQISSNKHDDFEVSRRYSRHFRVNVWLTAFIIIFSQTIFCKKEDEFCTPPSIDESVTPSDFCKVLRKVCFYQNALVSFDPYYSASYDPATNRSELRQPLPYLPTWTSSWNIPGVLNTDAIVGNQEAYTLTLRPASRLDAALDLHHPQQQQQQQQQRGPAFSRCTVPAVLLADWPFNFGEFFANGASTADLLFRRLKMLPDRDVTLALALPAGLSLMTFHQALLGHLSVRPLTTLERIAAEAEVAAVRGDGSHVPSGSGSCSWSHDGVPRACFERVLVCKLQGTHQSSPLATAAIVAAHINNAANGGPLPYDPLGFGAVAGVTPEAAESGVSGEGLQLPSASPINGQDSTLRVAVEVRRGGVRTIRNLHQVVDECNKMEWKEVGGFDRIVCRPLVTYDTPQQSGMERFRATVAAVRSAHVLVAVHGAGATNGFFLRPHGGAAAALLEVRPCGFGSGFPWWVDVHMAIHLPRLGDEVRFHAYNIEDPTQCSPSDYESAMLNSTRPVNIRAGGGHFMRDQHLTLRPDGLMAMLRHVASMLRNQQAYDAAKASGRLHGYALPGKGREGGGAWGNSGGVILGPLGLGNFSQHAESGAADFVLQPG
ncbi:hypothetical protein VaNZ11_010594 [Volvox africanus]|uniref:Uncharacterized protein n=1 Tax=Volvox africanus TaxID=51714 RepID=A0ABQ5SB43_9CHLO|nr:hypothetical protein VaNZ11_010594 [Volvox africanus]